MAIQLAYCLGGIVLMALGIAILMATIFTSMFGLPRWTVGIAVVIGVALLIFGGKLCEKSQIDL